MGVRRTTYTEIQTRLLDKVADLKVVALYNGQPEVLKSDTVEEIPFTVPAVFVELGGGEAIRNASLQRDYEEYAFRLHCLYELYQDDFSGSAQQQAALDHLDQLEEVMNALDGWKGATYVDEFKLRGEILDADRTHLVYHILEFTGYFRDCSLVEAQAGDTALAADHEIIRTGQSEHQTIIDGNITNYDEEDNPYSL